MKRLISCCLLILFCPALLAASINLDGETTWSIRSGQCNFATQPIQNLSPSNTTSGSLKLVLWMSPQKFPSRGFAVSEFLLGQLRGLTQFDALKLKAPLRIPRVDGTFYFTIYVAEYTTIGWQTRAYQEGDTLLLEDGNFLAGGTWKPSDKTLFAPPAKLAKGATITLNPRATGDFKQLSPYSIFQSQVNQNTKTTATLTRLKSNRKAATSYKIVKGTLNGKSGNIAILTLDYAKAANSKATSKAELILYFQGAGSGVYRINETESKSSSSTWGLFKLSGN